MIDIEKLEALAEAAVKNEFNSYKLPTIVAFDHAATPAAVLELIAELKGYRENPGIRAIQSLRGDVADLMAERDRLKLQIEGATKLCPCGFEACALHMWPPRVWPEVVRLKAENEELRKDAERLDLLDAQRQAYGISFHEGNVWEIDGQFATVRDAIDALLSQEAKP